MAIHLTDSITLYVREDWSARPPRGLIEQGWNAREVFIHHTADRPRPNTLEEQFRQMRAYQNFHMDVRGWNDLAYHFIVMQPFRSDGGADIPARIFQGRPRNMIPAAQEHHNTGTLAVCVMGDFSPGKDTLHRNTRFAIEVLLNQYDKLRVLGGHRQVVGTSCPGDQLYRELGKIADVCGLKRYGS